MRTDRGRRPVLAATLAGLALGLGACGVSKAGASSPPPAGHGAHAANASLCKSIDSLDRLVVTRTVAFPQDHLTFTFPTRVVVDNPADVRQLAGDLCSLPPFPRGLMCLVDLGISYNLAFSAGDHLFPTVSVDPGGCQGTSGMQLGDRWTGRSPGFWVSLGQAMRVPHPSAPVFAGESAGARGGRCICP